MQRTSAFRILTSALVNAPTEARIQVDQYDEVRQSVPRAHVAAAMPTKLLPLLLEGLQSRIITFIDSIQRETFKTKSVAKV